MEMQLNIVHGTYSVSLLMTSMLMMLCALIEAML